MLATTLVALLFAAGSIAAPVNKREIDVTLVTEIEYVDQFGDFLSASYVTGTPTASGAVAKPTTPVSTPPQAPNPIQPAQPAAPAGNSPPADSPAPSPSPAAPPAAPPASSPSPSPVSQSTGGTSSGSVSGSVQAYVQANSNDVTTHVGFVDGSDAMFGQIAVYHHNVHRANHSVSMVEYNETMAAAAQSWADSCASDEVVPKGSGWGMNIAFSSTTDNYNPSQFITGSWYNSELGEFPAYDVGTLDVSESSNFNNWGHFSQVVWPNVTQIGCGIATNCGGSMPVHAGCFYYVEGNIQGEFNVVPKPNGGQVVFPNGQTSF